MRIRLRVVLRKFYLCYPNCQTVSDKLTWSHICELIKIDDKLERSFYEKECVIYIHGRHTYWTNVPFNPQGIPQEHDFKQIPGYGCVRLKSYVQGGKNVNDVFDYFLDVVENRKI